MTVIVVSGAPGTGKSTVAAALAAQLHWPALELDTIKEALADVLGLGGHDWPDRLGDAAAEVLFRLCARFPDVVAAARRWWSGRTAQPPQTGPLVHGDGPAGERRYPEGIALWP